MPDQQPLPSHLDSVAASFAQQVRQFHTSLPAAEQVLLEQVFTLAAQAAAADTQGYVNIVGQQTSLTPVPLNPQFFAALVAEVGFPALDAASKDAAKLTIKFSPEYTRYP